MSKNSVLKEMIYSNKLEYILESHNAISGKIVEETGFKALWASSLTISASMGARDCNEISWSDIVNEVWKICDNTSIPLLLDMDTGYGDFNNARYILKKCETVGISGVCIEDKIFPKMNSFVNGEKQSLANKEEFCGKLKALKDAKKDKDFCIVARTESFIVGAGLQVAIERAKAYHNAGADAIVVHSKEDNANQIIDFMKAWDNSCPIIIIPTKYYSVPTSVYKDIGISTVIWANHMLRASIKYMQYIANKIYKEESISEVENQIASIKEILRLQNMDELLSAQNKYYKDIIGGENV